MSREISGVAFDHVIKCCFDKRPMTKNCKTKAQCAVYVKAHCKPAFDANPAKYTA